jgi:hypothetical protein
LSILHHIGRVSVQFGNAVHPQKKLWFFLFSRTAMGAPHRLQARDLGSSR